MSKKAPTGNFHITKDERKDLVESGEWEELPRNGEYYRYARLQKSRESRG